MRSQLGNVLRKKPLADNESRGRDKVGIHLRLDRQEKPGKILLHNPHTHFDRQN